MNPDFDPLESKLHRVLRALPDRAAPSTLEARVMAALAERAARPWWRRSYAGWPMSVRIGFFLLAGLLAGAVIIGVSQLPALASVQSAVANWREVYNSLLETAGTVVAAIPRLYLYGALAVLGACYVTLMGVGAAYRTLLVRS